MPHKTIRVVKSDTGAIVAEVVPEESPGSCNGCLYDTGRIGGCKTDDLIEPWFSYLECGSEPVIYKSVTTT